MPHKQKSQTGHRNEMSRHLRRGTVRLGQVTAPHWEEPDRSGTNVDTWKISAFIAISSASRSASWERLDLRERKKGGSNGDALLVSISPGTRLRMAKSEWAPQQASGVLAFRWKTQELDIYVLYITYVSVMNPAGDFRLLGITWRASESELGRTDVVPRRADLIR
jgi:hypothetical protein